MNRRSLQADLMLLTAALVWGGGFAAQRAAMEGMGPMAFTSIRFLIGWLVLQPILMGRRPRPALGPDGRRAAVMLGAVLLAGAFLQQLGLVYTSASKAGFLTGLYVIFVPLVGLFLGHQIRWPTWAGAGLCLVGLYLLSVTEALRLALGDSLVLFGAVVWAVHVILLGRFAVKLDPLSLAAGQFLTVGLVAGLLALAIEPVHAIAWSEVWLAILYSGVFAVGLAFTLQVLGQASAPPAHAAILMSFEAVFAAFAGGWLLGEQLNGRELAGCTIMFAGILVAQIRGRKLAAEPGASQCR